MTETAYPGLIDELAQLRKSAVPPPITLAECRNALAFLKDLKLVDNATHVRCYEFLLESAGQVDNLRRLAEAWKQRADAAEGWRPIWRPIDSAPKDGRLIVGLSDGGRPVLLRWQWSPNAEVHAWCGCQAGLPIVLPVNPQPTKWRFVLRVTERRKGLPDPEGKAIVARAAGERRHRATWNGTNLRFLGERRQKHEARTGFDTRERRSGNDRRKS